MSKFSGHKTWDAHKAEAKRVKATASSPVKTKDSGKPAATALGGAGFERKTRSELFLLAVANMVGQNEYHETAKKRDERFVRLCRTMAAKDPVWYAGFVKWLRAEGNMRSAATVAGVEGALGFLEANGPVGAQQFNFPAAFVDSSIQRADEPGEVLGYYLSTYVENTRSPKSIPAAIKKGAARGAVRTWNEYSVAKYDTDSHAMRFADVLSLTRPQAANRAQHNLFKYIIDTRFGNEVELTDNLPKLQTRSTLFSTPVAARRNLLRSETGRQDIANAGITWEALSGWLQSAMDAEAWEAVIPTMGYMALLRNLRNFTEAGISAQALQGVLAKLADPVQVARSKQFPFRFLAAYQANERNLPIAAAVEQALQHSLANVPSLKGRTLVLVDRSGSMFTSTGGVQGLNRADTAALFGTAVALRAENADLVEYGQAWRGQPNYRTVNFRKGDSLLPLLKQFTELGGTDTIGAIQGNYKGHDRIVLITDEQHSGYRSVGSAVPANVPLYTWNLAGYSVAQAESGPNRHTFGGLTDKGFQMIPLLEAGYAQAWPWEANS